MGSRRNAEAMIEAQEALETALAAEEPRWIGFGQLWMGIAADRLGEPERAQVHFQESLALARQTDDRTLCGFVVAFSAAREPLSKRRAMLEEWLPKVPLHQKPWLQMDLAKAALSRGDLAAAEGLLLESYQGWLPQRNNWFLSATLLSLTDISMWRGDYDGAECLLAQGQTRAHLSGGHNVTFLALAKGGLLAWAIGDQEQAARFLQESLALARDQQRSLDEALAQCLLGLVACEESHYDDAEALCSHALEVIPEAHGYRLWAFLALGRAALLGGETARAVDLYRQAVDHARHSESRPDIAQTCEYLAWAQAADGQYRQAAHLLAVAARERDDMGIALFLVDRPHHAHAMETVRGALDEEVLAAAWAAGEVLSLDEAVSWALEQAADGPPHADHDE
jgi:tetratricopeptide (TPR) repeat protein